MKHLFGPSILFLQLADELKPNSCVSGLPVAQCGSPGLFVVNKSDLNKRKSSNFSQLTSDREFFRLSETGRDQKKVGTVVSSRIYVQLTVCSIRLRVSLIILPTRFMALIK